MNELIEKVIETGTLCGELGIGNLSEGQQRAFLLINYTQEDLTELLIDVPTPIK
jgi:hypothetical protein